MALRTFDGNGSVHDLRFEVVAIVVQLEAHLDFRRGPCALFIGLQTNKTTKTLQKTPFSHKIIVALKLRSETFKQLESDEMTINKIELYLDNISGYLGQPHSNFLFLQNKAIGILAVTRISFYKST